MKILSTLVFLIFFGATLLASDECTLFLKMDHDIGDRAFTHRLICAGDDDPCISWGNQRRYFFKKLKEMTDYKVVAHHSHAKGPINFVLSVSPGWGGFLDQRVPADLVLYYEFSFWTPRLSPLALELGFEFDEVMKNMLISRAPVFIKKDNFFSPRWKSLHQMIIKKIPKCHEMLKRLDDLGYPY